MINVIDSGQTEGLWAAAHCVSLLKNKAEITLS